MGAFETEDVLPGIFNIGIKGFHQLQTLQVAVKFKRRAVADKFLSQLPASFLGQIGWTGLDGGPGTGIACAPGADP